MIEFSEKIKFSHNTLALIRKWDFMTAKLRALLKLLLTVMDSGVHTAARQTCPSFCAAERSTSTVCSRGGG